MAPFSVGVNKAETSWRWLLTELGYTPFQRWEAGRSLKFKDT
jgi:hypothetical protein